MEQYWKTLGGILIVLVLWISLQKQEKDLSLLLSMAGCILGAMVLLSLLEPAVGFLQEIEVLAGLGEGVMGTLLKVLGVGLTGELAAMLCNDGGNAALGKLAGLLTTAVMLLLSIPMMQSLLTLIQEILVLV